MLGKTCISYINNNVNHTKKRSYIPEEDKCITLRVSTTVLKTINKKGISAVIKEARANGFLKK